jgi:hypothetical protein
LAARPPVERDRSQNGLFPEFFASFPDLRVGNFASVVFNHPVADASRQLIVSHKHLTRRAMDYGESCYREFQFVREEGAEQE